MATKHSARKKKYVKLQAQESPTQLAASPANDYDDIREMFGYFTNDSVESAEVEHPDTELDDEVSKIFTQAAEHRDQLVNFFTGYTWVFSAFVAVLIIGQAFARAFMPNMQNVELVPYWALNLLVVGLVGQFITLLTIVTKKVWLFEEFFRQADRRYLRKSDKSKNSHDGHS